MMEALSTGCCIVASNTEPVKEIIKSGKNGVLVDFFDSEGMSTQIDSLLSDEKRRFKFGYNGRSTILENGYDLKTCVKAFSDTLLTKYMHGYL